MKRITTGLFLIFFILLSTSCRSNKDDCIDSLMKEKGYSYKDAKDACEDAQIDTYAR